MIRSNRRHLVKYEVLLSIQRVLFWTDGAVPSSVAGVCDRRAKGFGAVVGQALPLARLGNRQAGMPALQGETGLVPACAD